MEQSIKDKVTRRLKTIEGQARGVQRLVADDAYCVDVITQVSAMRHALSAVEDLLLENHLSTCTVKQMKGRSQTKAVSEILAIYALSKKK